MITNERHAGEEGVIRSDIAEMIDRAAAMAVYATTPSTKPASTTAKRSPSPRASSSA